MSFAQFDLEAQRTAAKPDNVGDFLSCISQLEKLVVLVGGKRDSPNLRRDIDQLIIKMDSLSQSLTTPNDPQNRLAETKLRKELQKIKANYHSLKSRYNDLKSSIIVEENYNQTAHEQTPLLQQSVQITNGISQNELDYHTRLIEQRDQDLRNLNSGVLEVNAIFHDLNNMVKQQGEHVDSIEDNLLTHTTNNQLANQELLKASEYQRKKRKCTFLLLVALIIVLVVVLAVVT